VHYVAYAPCASGDDGDEHVCLNATHWDRCGGRQARRKLAQLQPFIAVFPQECMGRLASVEQA
jgi:hypothetical protein